MKNGFITEYLSGLVGEPLVMVPMIVIMEAIVIDMITGSNYRDEILPEIHNTKQVENTKSKPEVVLPTSIV